MGFRGIMEKNMETTIMGLFRAYSLGLGLYWDNGKLETTIEYRDDGKENGNYYQIIQVYNGKDNGSYYRILWLYRGYWKTTWKLL